MRINKTISRTLKLLGICSLALFTTSCATLEHPDPLEKINRVMFGVDRVLDDMVVEPVARIYDILPCAIHKRVGNFFSNTFEPAVVVNDFLQGDINNAFMDFGRFLVNSTFGIAGLFDVAKHMGLVKHYNDFGITLAKWGFKNSAYLYIPLLGPMTIRDSASLAVDYWAFNPISYIPEDKIRLSIVGTGMVHWRWRLLPADQVRREAFDPYVFMRDAFLQKRRAIINEVVKGHHAPEDTYVHELDEPIIDDESMEEALEEAKADEEAKQASKEETKQESKEESNAETKQQEKRNDIQPLMEEIKPESDTEAKLIEQFLTTAHEK